MVEYGLLARGEDHRLAGEAAAIRKLLQKALVGAAWTKRRKIATGHRAPGADGRRPSPPEPEQPARSSKDQ